MYFISHDLGQHHSCPYTTRKPS